MNVFKSLFVNFKPSLSRFTAMYIFAILSTILMCVYAFIENISPIGHDDLIEQLNIHILDFCFIALFSLAFKLFSEKFFEQTKRIKILNIAVPIVLAAIFYFYCKGYDTNKYFTLVYACACLCTVLFICGYFVAGISKEKTLANIIGSYFFTWIVAVCVGISLSIIFFAVDTLIFEMGDYFDALLVCSWIISLYLIYLSLSVSYITRKYEDISISKAFKGIFLYTLFPLYAVLIFVLYIYLFKALFTFSLPSGTINPFVSGATFCFIVFNLSFRIYEDNKIVKFFLKFGGWIIFPLVVIQIIAFAIRVNAYGFTVIRLLSLYYIIFSAIFVVLSILTNFEKFKKLNMMQAVFILASVMFAMMALPKINLYDVTDRSMIGIIENIYKEHDLYDEQSKKFNIEAADSVLTNEEKQAIKTSFDQIEISLDKLEWVVFDGKSADFEKTFGFEKKWRYVVDNSSSYYKSILNYNCDDSNIVDIRGFNELISFNVGEYAKEEIKIVIKKSNGAECDITDYINSLITPDSDSISKTKKLVLDYDSKTRIIITTINIHSYDEKISSTVMGYILTK